MSRRFVHLLLASLLLFFGSDARTRAAIGTELQMLLGNPSDASADTGNHQHYLIRRNVEAMDYNDSRGTANWVSWNLSASDLGDSGRSSSFLVDSTLPAGFYRVTTGDYTNSGYNRGHLCPSADRTDTDANNALVFYLSNILPQTADNNQGPWVGLESYCRTLANAGNELLIIAGGAGYTGSTIASGKVAVPSSVWKVAVVVPSGAGSTLSRINTATRVIAVDVPNVSGIRNTPWAQFVTSPHQIEATTGYTFFTTLPANVAAVLRARIDGAAGASLAAFFPALGGEGAQVVITGSGFTGASSVAFGGVGAFFVVNSDTQITATVPLGAASGPVSVITPGGLATSSTSFSVMPAPTIAGFTPASAQPNVVAVISGSAFADATAVKFNGVAADFVINSDTQLSAAVPVAATTGPIEVVTPYGSTLSQVDFVVLPARAPKLLISQVYGGGGNTGAIYKQDFIEIYNAGNAPADLTDHAVQYASAGGSTWQATRLGGTLAPGHYCLIQEATGSGGTLDLPTPQFIGTISMSAMSGKVALTRTPTLLTVADPTGNPDVIDFIGYGSATSYEGGASAPLLTATTSATRLHLGGTDTNDNAADFVAATVAPQNGAAIDAWRSRKFTPAELADSAVSADTANPTGDGLTNLAKYAFNLDPCATAGAPPVAFALEMEGSERVLTLTHRRNHFAADVTFVYETSYDLVTWTPIDSPLLDIVVLDDETDLVSVSVRTSAPAIFIRAKPTR